MQYVVDIDLDPGSQMMDGTTAELMFEDVLNDWLSDRLSRQPSADDPISVLARDDPSGLLKQIRKLAELKREHPEAATIRPRFEDRPDREFVEAVRSFARWFATVPGERQTAEIMGELEHLSQFYADCLAETPDFSRLWALVDPPTSRLVMVKDTSKLAAYRCKSFWLKVSPERGATLNEEASRHYDAVDRAYQVLRGELANALIEKLSLSLDAAITMYTRRKRETARLDFDDLLRLGSKLVRNPAIRAELHRAFPRLLVDEFQDTDRRQAEIIFSIASTAPFAIWQQSKIEPGGLFLVGDPKQGIYSFRGADIRAYLDVRKVIEAQTSGRVIQITDSFRSREPIVSYVNGCFAPVFEGNGQPPYVALKATRGPSDGVFPEVSQLLVDPEVRSPSADRDEEARQVAQLCSRLIGAVDIDRNDDTRTPLRASDIALLAPTGAELWRYERALEAVGLVVASQAGKGLFLRQEVQDVVALLRALADPTDRLAFIALMRGPFVGLTDQELLDADEAMLASTPVGEKLRHFSILTPVEAIENSKVQSVLSVLQRLHSRRHFTTPSLLLAEAIEAMNLAAVLALRHPGHSQRSLANLGMLVELLRRDDVAGLQSAIQRLDAEWTTRSLRSEGRVDPSGDAVEIVTMHHAKGLEWPVVIPINATTRLFEEKQFLHRASDDTLHWVVGGVASPELALAKLEQEQALRLERMRMWYVALTRARDLLVVPMLPQAKPDSWSRLVHLKQGELPVFPIEKLPSAIRSTPTRDSNDQDARRFAEEGERVKAASPPLRWRQPSLTDPDRSIAFDVAVPAAETTELGLAVVGAGRLRGLVLHKLMEELITGEVEETEAALIARAALLLEQLSDLTDTSPDLPRADELGRTALTTIRHPKLVRWRALLVAEVAVWGNDSDGTLLAGRADALAIEDGALLAVLDWKSDKAPNAKDRLQHVTQIKQYMQTAGSDLGVVVYMTTQEVVEVR
jgi:ATP-dependent exoDNAse (exonuclease V) beta subunit